MAEAKVDEKQAVTSNALEIDTSRSVSGSGRADSTGKNEAIVTIQEGSKEGSKASGSSPPEDQDIEYPTGLRFWLILLSLYAVTALTAVDQNIVATAVPRMTDDFHTIVGVGWYASAFRLCVCSFYILFGKLYTQFLNKRVFLASAAIWIVGIVLCGAAVSPAMFIIGRAIAGVGTAGLTSGTNIIIVHTIPIQKRSLFQGLDAAIEGLSVLVGPLLGGVLTQYLNWRWCFYINLPFGGVCLLLIIFCLNITQKIDEKPLKERIYQLDIVSNILIIGSLTSLFLALGWAGTTYDWSSGTIIGLLVTFGVLLVVFIYNQYRRGDSAVLPLRIFKRRDVAASMVFVFTLNSAGNILDYYLPTYFQAGHGYSPASAGYLMVPIIVGGTLGAIIQGVGTSVTGQYGPFMLTAAVGMAVAAGLITTFGSTTELAKLIVYTGLSGLSYGFGIAAPAIAIQFVLAPEDIPLGMSTMLFLVSLGPAIAIAVAQVLFTNQLTANLASVPGFNAKKTVNNGLTEFVARAPKSQKNRILDAIARSMLPIWWMAVGLTCASVLVVLLVKWRSLKTEDEGGDSNNKSDDQEKSKAGGGGQEAVKKSEATSA